MNRIEVRTSIIQELIKVSAAVDVRQPQIIIEKAKVLEKYIFGPDSDKPINKHKK